MQDTSDDLCEDVEDLHIWDGINEASDGAVSDTCSEEEEDFQAARLAADGEMASKVAQRMHNFSLAGFWQKLLGLSKCQL